MERESKCPALGGPHRHTAVGTMSNQHWWPNQLNLKILHQSVSSALPREWPHYPPHLDGKQERLTFAASKAT